MKVLNTGLTIIIAINFSLPAMADQRKAKTIAGIGMMTAFGGASVLANSARKDLLHSADNLRNQELENVKSKIQGFDDEMSQLEDEMVKTRELHTTKFQFEGHSTNVNKGTVFTGANPVDVYLTNAVHSSIQEMEKASQKVGVQGKYSISVAFYETAKRPYPDKIAGIAKREGLTEGQVKDRLFKVEKPELRTLTFQRERDFQEFLADSAEGSSKQVRQIKIYGIVFSHVKDAASLETKLSILKSKINVLSKKRYALDSMDNIDQTEADLPARERLKLKAQRRVGNTDLMRRASNYEAGAKFMVGAKVIGAAGGVLGACLVVFSECLGSANAGETVDTESDPGLDLAMRKFKEDNQAKLNTGTGEGVEASN